MAKGAFSAHLHAVLELFRVAKYVPNAAIVEPQQHSHMMHRHMMLGHRKEPAMLQGHCTTAQWDAAGAVSITRALLELTMSATCSRAPCSQQTY